MATRKEIEERRQAVMDMLDRGANQLQIARQLKLNRHTIAKDMKAINRKANDLTNEMARETINAMFQSCIRTQNSLMLECWQIYSRNNDNIRDTTKHVTMNIRMRAIELLDRIVNNKMTTICNGPAMMELNRLNSEVASLKRGLDITV